VKSAFAEVLLPFVTPQNAMAGVYRLEANLSARTDRYSDFGGTNNPKIALNREPVGEFEVSANWGKSFVAPALTSIGSDDKGTTGESSFGNYGLGAINVPVANFPLVAQLPGCAGLATCTLGSGALTGAQINGGNPTLVAQDKTYGLGFDWTPEAVRGLAISATYWNNKLTGGVTAPVPAFALNTAALANLLTIYPGGASAAQIAAARGNLAIGSALPTNIYFIYNYQQRNVLNLNVTGVDLDVRYALRYGHRQNFDRCRPIAQVEVRSIGRRRWPSVRRARHSWLQHDVPVAKTEARANLGWKRGPINTMLYVNYTGGYTNWSAGAVNPVAAHQRCTDDAVIRSNPIRPSI
jgi:iron complex outermembrane receptor protein